MYFLSSTKSWNALPGKIVLITHLLICFKNLLRDLYLTALCLVNSVSSVVIVFLLWFHNTSRGYQNPMSFISLCSLQVKKPLTLLLGVIVLGEIGPESSCNSHALQVIATSSRWLQSCTPIVLLEQEVSVDSVPKQLTLSSQIGPVVDPNL